MYFPFELLCLVGLVGNGSRWRGGVGYLPPGHASALKSGKTGVLGADGEPEIAPSGRKLTDEEKAKIAKTDAEMIAKEKAERAAKKGVDSSDKVGNTREAKGQTTETTMTATTKTMEGTKFILGSADRDHAREIEQLQKIQKWEKTTLSQIKKLSRFDPSDGPMTDYDKAFHKIQTRIYNAQDKYKREFSDLDMDPLLLHLRQTWEGNRDDLQKRRDQFLVKRSSDLEKEARQERLRKDREDYTPWMR